MPRRPEEKWISPPRPGNSSRPLGERKKQRRGPRSHRDVQASERARRGVPTQRGDCAPVSLHLRVLLRASPCAHLPALPAQPTRMKARSCRNEKWGSESLPALPSALIFPPVADWCSKDPGLSSSSVMCGSLWKLLSHN